MSLKSSNKIEENVWELEVAVDGETFMNAVNKAYLQQRKKINVPGFRKGKAPRAFIEKMYGEAVFYEDALEIVYPDAVSAAIEEAKLEVIDTPFDLEVPEMGKDGVVIKLKVTVMPEVKLGKYKGIKATKKSAKVSAEDVKSHINNMLEQNSRIVTVETKRKVKKNDIAVIDFEGFVDGVAFEGGKAENYILEIGSGQFIPGFEDGMIGLKVGEERDVKVTFPAEYGAAALAGKDAVFKVKLHEIGEQKKAELNEETLKKIMPNEQNPSKEMLEASIKDQIRTSKFITLLNGEIKDKFAQALTKKFNFDLPENIIDQEMNVRFRNDWYSFSDDERKKYQEDKKALEAKLESYKEEASNSVKLTFIIDELAKVNKIEVSDQELIQTIYMEAYRSGRNPKEHMEYYKKNGMLPAVKMAIVEEKLFLHLFPLPKDEQIEKAKKASSVKKEAEPKAAEKKPTSKKAAESTEEKPKRGRKKKKEE